MFTPDVRAVFNPSRFATVAPVSFQARASALYHVIRGEHFRPFTEESALHAGNGCSGQVALRIYDNVVIAHRFPPRLLLSPNLTRQRAPLNPREYNKMLPAQVKTVRSSIFI